MRHMSQRQGKRHVTMTLELNTIRLSDSPRGLRAGTAMLRAGGLVAFPTETVYGLGADACNGSAVASIYAAKGRPSFNPLIVHVHDLEAAQDLVEFSEVALELAMAFWPGPLTLVLPIKTGSGISELVTAGLPTLAVRIPANPVAQSLLATFDGPIAAPSANPSGKVSPTHADHVLDGLYGRIGAVIDGGACIVGLESTILGFDDETPVLLRPGGIAAEQIEDVTGLPLRLTADDKITAPGQLASHYAPDVSLKLNATQGDIWLGFGPLNGRNGLSLSTSGDLNEAASNLFTYLREIDVLARDQDTPVVSVDPIPETGLGRAINDRLRRAAAPR